MNLRRIYWIAYKEVLHLLRDPRSLILAVGLPVLLTLLFGWVLRLDVRGLELVVVDPRPTPESRRLVATIAQQQEIRRIQQLSDRTARRKITTGKVHGILWIPPGWRGDLQDPLLGLWVDGRDPLKGKALIRIVDGVVRSWGPPKKTVPFSVRIWYNPEMKSQIAIIPGLMALILLLVAALQPSIALAREFESHTFDQLRLTPITVGELLIGKLLPYFLLGYQETIVVLGIALGIFGVPMRGSWMDLFLLISLFLLTAVALGIFFSVVTKNQQAAMQYTWLATFLPSFFLSGFVFPLRSMPVLLQWVSYAVPARYFIRALRGVMLKGAGLGDLYLEALGLLLLAGVWMGISAVQVRRQSW